MTHKQHADLTFKANIKKGRHGWIRLTPAYSVKIVEKILSDNKNIKIILDPFSGTGTTGLVAKQLGRQCDLLDINPFLVWLAKVKCRNYSEKQLQKTRVAGEAIITLAQDNPETVTLWLPNISNIERWWSFQNLTTLARIFQALNDYFPEDCPEKDLLLITFCRLAIQWSNAAFNHQSMSFKTQEKQMRLFANDPDIYQDFLNKLDSILLAAKDTLTGKAQAYLMDSRHITKDKLQKYDAVITSPPYVNRMSYIRELRPYMYWLGYLKIARDAGELDWQAIGGTWGIATSRLKHWSPNDIDDEIPSLASIVDEISQSSEVLSRYVHKYFVDISTHLRHLNHSIVSGGKIFYIVGNSKFYNTLVPTEQIYAELMEQHGFINSSISIVRKRNSKKELFEFLVTAEKPH